MKKWIYGVIVLTVVGFAGFKIARQSNTNRNYVVGQRIDSLHGVFVYYNGGVDHVAGRNTTANHYNLGLKYQCVEFVKRYYYEKLHHQMPDSYGHAKDFFDKRVGDGQQNKRRNLTQYTNASKSKPQADDLIIFGPTAFNRYGHVAIISEVTANDLEIVQQNPGPYGKSRERMPIKNDKGRWAIDHNRVLGWLRKE